MALIKRKERARDCRLPACLAGLVLAAGCCWFWPPAARGWGSYTAFEAHQFILNQAFDMLKQDPAYQGGVRFLLRKEILANEGVWGLGSGTGPDVEGSTLYSEHYYNPILKQGGAPRSTGREYETLARAIVERTGEGAKAAAWGAHFLADMSVIYHVMGLDRAALMKTYSDQGGSNAVACNLTEDVTGNRDHMSYTFIWSYGSNFLDTVKAYLKAEATSLDPKGNRYLDFFDPWYFNGFLAQNLRSSHLSYEEGFVIEWQRPFSTTPIRYHDWVNPAPAFDAPWTRQRANAEALARNTALNTRNSTKAWHKDVSPAMDQAIQTVFTLWRASFSALTPRLAVTPAPEPNQYTVKGTVFNAENDDPASQVQLRLTVQSGGTREAGDEIQGLPDVPPGKETEAKDAAEWTVKSTDIKNCLLRVEAIGHFAKTPDLQYTRVEKYLDEAEVAISVLFLMDCSGSMAGEKLENTKRAAQEQVALLREESEIAVMAFSDSAWSVTPFLIMTPEGRNTTIQALDGLGSGGGTALAASIRTAGSAIRYRARGKLLRALVIQSDGEETCGGDPVAAVAEVNAQAIQVQGGP